MSTYIFGRQLVAAEHPSFPGLVAMAHADKTRPLCACKTPGVPMYIARVGERYIVKRMPSSGIAHHPDCQSFEPPPELSGLGEVSGSAIQEDVETGMTTLKLDFSLSRAAGRSAPPPKGAEADTVRTDGSKLTLRGLLHYLWEESGLNKWSPAMDGKRSWYVVRKFLLQAALQKDAKGSPLDTLLFIPESFSIEKKDDIERRRLAKLSRIVTPAAPGGNRPLMLLVGEVKEIAPARYGQKIIVKHLPSMHFMLADDLAKKMAKRFVNELALWNADESTHLMLVATFGIGASGFVTVEEMALMVTSSNWIPVEHAAESELVAALTADHRRFAKGMRYNLATTKPLATVVLTDSNPKPVAMYVMPMGASDEYRDALGDLIDTGAFPPWLWKPESEPMPALPSIRDYTPGPILLGAAAPQDEATEEAE